MGQDWEGRTVDGKYALLEWLGGSGDHCAFLTIRQGAQRAVIKLIAAEGADADAYLTQWEAAKTLSHPHLMPVLETGRSAIDGVPLVYVITDHAEKVLSNFLPERALHAHEAKDFIEPVLDALSCLHANGFIHGHVKPSNILVSSGELKLSADNFLVAPGVPTPVRKSGAYDAPEVPNGTLTAKADTWSVGMTLLEALTQNPPVPGRYTDGDPVVPKTLPQPFFEIVRECLRSNPAQRYTIEMIKARLDSGPPASVAAKQPVTAPEPIPVAPKPIGRFEPLEPFPQPALFADYEEESSTKSRVRPIVIGTLILLAVVAVVLVATNKLKVSWPLQSQSSHMTIPSPAQSQPSLNAPSDTQSAPPTNAAVSPAAASGGTPSAPAAPAPSQSPAEASNKVHTPSTTSPVEQETEPPASQAPSDASSGATTKGAVAQRVVPSVSPGARESMHGPVTVEVRVFVDRNGTVSNAAYVTQGPGNYFARLSVRTAESWKFTPPQLHGHPEPSVWTLHFYFFHGSTEVTATEEGR